MNRPRIIVADARRLLREGCAELLAVHGDVVETVSDGQKLVNAAVAWKPDLVVLATDLPTFNGLEAGRQVKALVPQVRLIYLADDEGQTAVVDAFRAGASGFLLNSSAGSELGLAMDSVIRGRVYVTPAAHASCRQRTLPNAELNPQRRQVLQLLADGYSLKEIARTLKVTPRTVAFCKYGMAPTPRSRSGAKPIRFAVEQLVPA